jgi:hypothetical protein
MTSFTLAKRDGADKKYFTHGEDDHAVLPLRQEMALIKNILLTDKMTMQCYICDTRWR